MKKLVTISIILSMICGAVAFSACNTKDNKLNIERQTQSASNDEIYPAQNLNSTEDSDNVNGKDLLLHLRILLKNIIIFKTALETTKS